MFFEQTFHIRDAFHIPARHWSDIVIESVLVTHAIFRCLCETMLNMRGDGIVRYFSLFNTRQFAIKSVVTPPDVCTVSAYLPAREPACF